MNEAFMVAMRRAGKALRQRRIRAAASALQHAFDPGWTASGRGSGGERAEDGGVGPPEALADGRQEKADGDIRPQGPPASLQGFAEEGGDWPKSGAGRNGPAARATLRETVRLLREGQEEFSPAGRPGDADGLKAPGPIEVPDGAGFHRRSFDCAAGARDYLLFVPALDKRPLQGAVLMLHGCTQTPEDFAAGTGMNALAQQAGFLVAYPQQTGEHSAMQCWSWYRTGDQSRGKGEPAILAGLAAALRDEFALPPDHVFAAGLSAGGAMAAILAETYPDLFEAIGVHSGVAPGMARDMLSAYSAMRGESQTGACWRLPSGEARVPRVIVFHGAADRIVNPVNARLIAEAAGAAHPDSEMASQMGLHPSGRGFERVTRSGPDGTPLVEAWLLEGMGHAWSGGVPGASYTDADGPNASAEMLRFFLRRSDSSGFS